jgi:hypothetical protein
MNGEVSFALDFIAKRSPDNGKREHFAVADEQNLRVRRVDIVNSINFMQFVIAERVL